MDETTVGVAEFGSHLGEYLERAKAGERIVVCEDGKPVAALAAVVELAPGLRLRPPSKPWSSLVLGDPIPTTTPIDVVALLREDRDQR